MASSKLFIAPLLFFVLAGHVVDAAAAEEPEAAAVTGIDCEELCGVRCGKSSRPNLCNRACGTCCSRCGCVPPGTYGNYDSCPCYASQTTRGGARKCP